MHSWLKRHPIKPNPIGCGSHSYENIARWKILTWFCGFVFYITVQICTRSCNFHHVLRQNKWHWKNMKNDTPSHCLKPGSVQGTLPARETASYRPPTGLFWDRNSRTCVITLTSLQVCPSVLTLQINCPCSAGCHWSYSPVAPIMQWPVK